MKEAVSGPLAEACEGSPGSAGPVLAVCLALVFMLACPAQARFAHGGPQPTEEIVNYFIYTPVGNDPEQHVEMKKKLRQRPEASAQLIARHLRLPENLDDWEMDVEQPVGEPFSRALRAIFNHKLLHELGREHADPILEEFFKGNRKLLEQAARQIQEQRREEVGDGEELARLQHAQRYFSSLMTRAIRTAVEMGTPVLVEPVLDFYEAGLEHQYTHWADYALIHAPQHKDVLPRLRAVKDDPATPESMRLEIGRALERFTESLALRMPPVAPPTLAACSSTCFTMS